MTYESNGNDAVQYLKNLENPILANTELLHFIVLCDKVLDKIILQENFDCLFNSFQLTPEQIVMLSKTDLLKYSIALKYSLKKYVSSRYYDEAEHNNGNEPTWREVLLVLGIFP